MRHPRIISIALLFSCLLAGCRKKESYVPSSAVNEPVFQVSGSVNGEPVLLQAGVNDYYMFASHRVDTGNIYVYTSSLKQNNCRNCGSRLDMEIRAYRPFTTILPINIDSALRAKSYNFQDENQQYFYEASFQSSYKSAIQGVQGMASRYSWDFGDGAGTSTSAVPKYLYKRAGTYPVCLTIKDTLAPFQSNVCNAEILSSPMFRSTISATTLPGRKVEFSQTTVGQGPFTYRWFFGDGDTSSKPNPQHTYYKHDVFAVELKVKDAAGNVCSARYNAYTDSTNKCAANYSVNVVKIPNLALDEIRLTWTDAHGKIYSSHKGEQIPGSYFRILNVQDYPANEKGERAKKLRLQFNCRLYRDGQYITLNNMEAILAITYP